jgi:hypothetical protein
LRGKTPLFLTHRTRSFRSVFGPEVREFYVIDAVAGEKVHWSALHQPPLREAPR